MCVGNYLKPSVIKSVIVRIYRTVKVFKIY